jgi:hypothetical protein
MRATYTIRSIYASDTRLNRNAAVTAVIDEGLMGAYKYISPQGLVMQIQAPACHARLIWSTALVDYGVTYKTY